MRSRKHPAVCGSAARCDQLQLSTGILVVLLQRNRYALNALFIRVHYAVIGIFSSAVVLPDNAFHCAVLIFRQAGVIGQKDLGVADVIVLPLVAFLIFRVGVIIGRHRNDNVILMEIILIRACRIRDQVAVLITPVDQMVGNCILLENILVFIGVNPHSVTGQVLHIARHVIAHHIVKDIGARAVGLDVAFRTEGDPVSTVEIIGLQCYRNIFNARLVGIHYPVIVQVIPNKFSKIAPSGIDHAQVNVGIILEGLGRVPFKERLIMPIVWNLCCKGFCLIVFPDFRKIVVIVSLQRIIGKGPGRGLQKPSCLTVLHPDYILPTRL